MGVELIILYVFFIQIKKLWLDSGKQKKIGCFKKKKKKNEKKKKKCGFHSL